MKASTIVLIVLGLAVVGGGLYFFVFRKKTVKATAKAATPPAAAPKSVLQQFESDALSFGFNEGKKALSSLFS
jgi:LPXTG-motif cell wall-anchored protein